MDRHNIPTAQYKTFSDLELAQDYVHEHGAPIVIKPMAWPPARA